MLSGVCQDTLFLQLKVWFGIILLPCLPCLALRCLFSDSDIVLLRIFHITEDKFNQITESLTVGNEIIIKIISF